MLTIRAIAVELVLANCFDFAGCEPVYNGVVGGDRPSHSSANLSSGGASTASIDPVAIPTCACDHCCLSVLSYNTKHRDVPIQMDAVARKLKADFSQPVDFILLQEVVFGRPKSSGRDNTAAALADLIGFQSMGTARDGGEEGVAILSRYPFEHYEYRHLKARDALLAGGFPRVSVMGEFRVPDLGLVRVVNVHLAYRVSQHDVRRAQLKETLEWMAQRQNLVPADVIVLGGDFNCEPGWDELALVSDANACGGLLFLNANSQTPTSGDVGDYYRRVDYIFVAAVNRRVESTGEVALWRSGIPTSDGSTRFFPSDHQPLLHVFAIKPE
jgi:endonuclease/exonuclease/phosphatase family metal-dependent hydrolase